MSQVQRRGGGRCALIFEFRFKKKRVREMGKERIEKMVNSTHEKRQPDF